MEYYFLVKWVHIVSSTILFGFGAGTAWYLWSAHLTGDPLVISSVGRMVVLADWIFTGTSGVMQPASGFTLVYLAGYSPEEPWLIVTYALYIVAFFCWAIVVWLQIKAQRLAQAALDAGTPLGDDYRRTMRYWFALGWPAFISLLVIFWLMTQKPALW
ncbi:MAG: DUF2269 domain-containing protein [Micropepsaceae bacterium]